MGYASYGSTAHAGLWRGTKASWVDLNPSGATGSAAQAVDDGVQVGSVSYYGSSHAALWRGTASSFVDLHPSGATDSDAYAVSGDRQAGYAVFGSIYHALVWSGTGSSYVDLNAYLPVTYWDARARSIQVSGNEIWVGGYARDPISGRSYATLWHYTDVVPEPSSLLALLSGIGGLGSALALKRRSR